MGADSKSGQTSSSAQDNKNYGKTDNEGKGMEEYVGAPFISLGFKDFRTG